MGWRMIYFKSTPKFGVEHVIGDFWTWCLQSKGIAWQPIENDSFAVGNEYFEPIGF